MIAQTPPPMWPGYEPKPETPQLKTGARSFVTLNTYWYHHSNPNGER